MNTVSTTPAPSRVLGLPNLLTFARIAAVPVVVALMYWQSILDGGLWLRWAALAVFITAGITDMYRPAALARQGAVLGSGRR